ncbi:MAG TPA: Mor transcription activator family protein [bacterium]|nr:Mor transcription activator family protein [bacterium]
MTKENETTKFRDWCESNMTLDDLPNEDLRMVAQDLGMDTALRLLRGFGGMVLSVPKTGLQKAGERYIKEFYGRLNVRQLVRETGICERQIYYILNGKQNEASQASLFDMDKA